MSKVFIEESTLTAIGDAIREKTGGTALIEVPKMASQIKGITTGDVGRDDFIPDSAFAFSGNCKFCFANGIWDWFLLKYGDLITTNNISYAESMFNYTYVKEIPFEINLGQCSYISSMFETARSLRELPTINYSEPPFWTTITYSGVQFMFRNCQSLRHIPEDFLKVMYRANDLGTNQMFYYCYALDEARGIPVGVITNTITSNKFTLITNNTCRLKDFIFTTQEDGTPYTVKWYSQTIDMTSYVGYCTSSAKSWITSDESNSGITADKEVKDDATYQALKNDADWFTCDISYSRYNHDSAVNTINSLPDTSAYLATQSGKTNTIKFKGESGSKTDGGAINTLTAEEIAIATAKGWTVSLA